MPMAGWSATLRGFLGFWVARRPRPRSVTTTFALSTGAAATKPLYSIVTDFTPGWGYRLQPVDLAFQVRDFFLVHLT
jgi:hypothetical protein